MKYKIIPIVLAFVLALTLVSALEFDNIIKYEEPDNKIVEFDNWYGLGVDIARAELKTPRINYVMPGKDRLVMQIDIQSYLDYAEAIKDLKILNMKNGKEEIKEFTWKYAVYETVERNVYEYNKSDCKEYYNPYADTINNECSRYIVDTVSEKVIKEWVPINSTNLFRGDTTLGLFTDVERGDHYDGIPTLFGKEVVRWAEWSDALNVGLKVWYNMSSLDDSLGVFNMTNNEGTPTFSTSNALIGSAMATAGSQNAKTYNNDIYDFSKQNRTISFWWDDTNHGTGTTVLSTGDQNTGFHIGHYASGDAPYNYNIYARICNKEVGATDPFADVHEGWNHIAIVNNGTGTSVYHNGTFKIGCTGFNSATNDYLHIGGNYNNGTDFAGQLEELGIWNRSLSAAEIADLYANGSAISYDPVPPNDAPKVSLNAPDNNTYFEGQSVTFNISATDDNGVINITFVLDDAINLTTTNTTASENISWEFTSPKISEGVHNWTAIARDGSNSEGTNNTFVFTIDLTDPVVSLIVPTNTTYGVDPGEINYTLVEVNPSACWYSTDEGATNTTDVCGTNVTGLTANEGPNNWTIYVNDSVGRNHSDSISFVLDTTPPIITYNRPTNITYYSSSMTFNITLNETGDQCIYSLAGGANNVSMTDQGDGLTFFHTNASVGEGDYKVYYFCNDTLGNLNNSASLSFQINLSAPDVNIVFPAENQAFTSPTVGINYTVSGFQVESCWWSKDLGATNNSLVCGVNFTDTFSYGTNNVIVFANNSMGLENNGTVNFVYDNINPTVSIIYPTATNYGFAVSELNYTVSDDYLSACWYSLTNGSTNTSDVCGTNVSGLSALAGVNIWDVYVNDTAGNTATDSVTFEYDTFPPQIEIIAPPNSTYYNKELNVILALNEPGDQCIYSFDDGVNNISLTKANTTYFTHNNASIAEGQYTIYLYCNDTVGNLNDSLTRTFIVNHYAGDDDYIYDLPSLDQGEGLFGLATYSNTVSGGLLMAVFFWVIFGIVFISSLSIVSASKALTFSCFIGVVSAIPLTVMNLLAPRHMYLLVFGLAISTFWSILENRT